MQPMPNYVAASPLRLRIYLFLVLCRFMQCVNWILSILLVKFDTEDERLFMYVGINEDFCFVLKQQCIADNRRFL